MKERLISFKTAKLAKDKGFNIHCRTAFSKDGGMWENEDFPYNSFNDNIFAPTQSLLQKWLREKHSIDIQVLGLSGRYYAGINNNKIHECSQYFYPESKKYEDILEIGLFKALETIDNGE